MTNDDMWEMVQSRTRGFFERVILPFGAYENENDFELAENYLRFQFGNSSSPEKWAVNFLKGIEETETKIVLHAKKLETFRAEISNSLGYVKMYSISDAVSISSNPPFETGRKLTL
jgi:hypothetical protein